MQFSDAEWKIMRAVWQRHPASARDVLNALASETAWAYTTVKTFMARMVEKGALKVRMRANTSLYEPLITESQARRSAIRSLLDKAFDGTAAPLMSFLLEDEKLSRKDRKILAALVDESKERDRNAAGRRP